jgi:F-type H+-transporting ATPase subunit delta
MAELVTIARPYAEAVFRIAKEKGSLAPWSEKLALLSAIAKDPQMHNCIGNPGLSIGQKADLVKTLCGETADGDANNLIQVLAENERLALLPEIAGLFETLKSNEEGIKDAVINSAFPLDAGQQKTLVADLESRFKTKLKATVVVDPSLIGGVKVVVGDQVLDLSVRAKLESMETALKN